MYGWDIGADIREKGLELNPAVVTVSADGVAMGLGLTLASERKVVTHKSATALAARAVEAETKSLAAIEREKAKLEYSTTLNDRYHNAAVSLAFVLDTAVFVQRSNDMDDTRALALHEFLQLAYWATPQSWSVRTGLIQQILQRLGEILTTGGPALLSSIVRQHQHQHMASSSDDVWGDIELKHNLGATMSLGVDVPHHHSRKESRVNAKELTKEEQQEQVRANKLLDTCLHA